MSNPIHGHGHVTPRLDGVLARCGGPSICKLCAIEKAQLDADKKALADMVSPEEQKRPSSRNIETVRVVIEGNVAFWVTAAEWQPYDGMESYEIGIRRAQDHTAFTLIQARWSESAVRLAAHGIAAMLKEGIIPDDIRKMFP